MEKESESVVLGAGEKSERVKNNDAVMLSWNNLLIELLVSVLSAEKLSVLVKKTLASFSGQQRR